MMCSSGINGEGELRGKPANPGSPGKWLLKWRVCVCMDNWMCSAAGSHTIMLVSRIRYSPSTTLLIFRPAEVKRLSWLAMDQLKI